MILVSYESHKGGVNNIAVATDTKTGAFATSTKGKERAIQNLRRRIKKTPTTERSTST